MSVFEAIELLARASSLTMVAILLAQVSTLHALRAQVAQHAAEVAKSIKMAEVVLRKSLEALKAVARLRALAVARLRALAVEQLRALTLVVLLA